MNKFEFLKELRRGLSGLPCEDVEERLEFYAEMIDDRVEEGLSEDEAVANIGNVNDVVSQIISDIPITKIVKNKIKPKRKLSAWEIVLLALGSPIWISLLAALFAVILSIYVALWSVIISLWAVFVSLAAGAVSGVVGCFFFAAFGNVTLSLVLLSAGLVLSGLSILALWGCKGATKGICLLTKKLAFAIKNLFIGKGKV